MRGNCHPQKFHDLPKDTVQGRTGVKNPILPTPSQHNCSSSSWPAETALGAQLSVLLSRIMNVTWVKVLASFSMKQSSINCSGSSGPRFQGTHSANDLLLSALGGGDEKEKSGLEGSPLPTSEVCSPGAEVSRTGNGNLEVLLGSLPPPATRQRPQCRFSSPLFSPEPPQHSHTRKASKMLEMQLHTTSLFICSLRGMRHLYFFLSLPAHLKKEVLFEGHLM